MAVTSMYFPSGRLFKRSMILRKSSLASLPMGITSSCCSPNRSCHSRGVGMFCSAASEICQSCIWVASYAIRWFPRFVGTVKVSKHLRCHSRKYVQKVPYLSRFGISVHHVIQGVRRGLGAECFAKPYWKVKAKCKSQRENSHPWRLNCSPFRCRIGTDLPPADLPNQGGCKISATQLQNDLRAGTK